MGKSFSDIIPPSFRHRIRMWIQIFLFLVSFIVVGVIVVDYGFVLDNHDMSLILKVYRYAWWIYLFAYLSQLTFQWNSITRKTVFMTVLFGILLFLSALPKFITPTSGWMTDAWAFFSHKIYMGALLGSYALLEISKGVVNFINKKTNPALLMAACFTVIIAFGALLLLLPRSTHEHIRLPLVDALFVSTSAVCITGLSTVDIAQTFSLKGQIVIMLLIQIGGLGVMTITSFFAMFFMGSTGFYNQFALRDMIGSDTFSSLISTLLYILGFTFVIEAVGAFSIWTSIHATMGMTIQEEIFFSVFHAISAFCNAGFSTLTDNLSNPDILIGHNGFYLILTILIVLGGIGFPILVNLRRVIAYYIGKLWLNHTQRYVHLVNINTKLVLTTSAILIVLGTISIAILEWDGTFAGMSTSEKLVQSLFNSVAPRTAGFNSMDMTRFSIVTILIYTTLMWIGGASQSTAGGIKVNTLAVAFANFVAIVRGRDRVILFHRELSPISIRRALAKIFGSILTIFLFFIVLVALEPELPVKGLFFETVSAYSTVGASLNITPLLGDDSKVLVSVLMFVGRVGLITMLMSLVQHGRNPKYRLPQDDVIIN